MKKYSKKKYFHNKHFIHQLNEAIVRYQHEHFINDSNLSKEMGLSEGLIGKIKSGKTNPSYATLKKLKDGGIKIPDIQSIHSERGNIEVSNHEREYTNLHITSHDPP